MRSQESSRVTQNETSTNTGQIQRPLRKSWKGLVREKTRRQDGAPPLLVEALKSIIEHLSRYSSSDDGPTGRLTPTTLRDRALLLLLVGWTGALRRSELVALTTEEIQFIEGEGANVYVRRSKANQEAEGRERPALWLRQRDLSGHGAPPLAASSRGGGPGAF